MQIDVKIISEAGFQESLNGLALNKKQKKDMKPVANKLAKMDSGHNKFLESMFMWVSVRAPRYWWVQADTYRLSTRQSESTMHTLTKDLNTEWKNFIMLFEDETSIDMLGIYFQLVQTQLKSIKVDEVFLKANLPESFMQKKLWVVSYKTMRNIINQRKNHRLPHWRKFVNDIMTQCQHPEFFEDLLDKNGGKV
jgi:hypothetical protein